MITDFRLKVFKTAADKLSFTKAATELFISQPAVTKNINELEKQLGTPLFLRHGNNISLTAGGTLLLKYANRILSLYSNLNSEFSTEGNIQEGNIAIGASTTLSQYVLPGILAKFKRHYRNIQVTLVNGNSEQIEKMVSGMQLDIGMVEGNASDHTLHYEPFINDELILVTASANPFNKDEITPEELKELPLVIREWGSGTLDIIEHTLIKHNISLKDLSIEMQLGSTESIKHYLFNSDAFAFLSIRSILEELSCNKLKVIEINNMVINRNFNFVTLHGQNNRLTNIFKQFCTEY
ncbi:MAG TPA: LysR family transcriptional regulator [Candidatus Avirikenella pullistercoris]|nr:LysR family transcriptional regulator [Candidatus Avirikenella pullistercoris]